LLEEDITVFDTIDQIAQGDVRSKIKDIRVQLDLDRVPEQWCHQLPPHTFDWFRNFTACLGGMLRISSEYEDG